MGSLAIEFPPISHLINWPNLFGTKGVFAINKVVLLEWLAVIIVLGFFWSARRGQLVPAGAQNLAEAVVDFVRNDIILQTIGPEGMAWAPFLLTLFTFSILAAALFASTYIGALIPGALLVALYAFEVLVSVLQAFIFTILTAVYIGGAMHPEH